MKKLLFLFLVTLFTVTLQAENVLMLTKPDSSQTHVFRKGSFLVFELKPDGSIREGFIREVTDSSLVFDNAQVSLSQIIILAGSTRGKIIAGRIASAVANGLIISGSVLFDCGLEFFTYDDRYYYWPLGGAIWLGGAIIAGVGYMFDWATCPVVRVRSYRGWDASIVSSTTVMEKTVQPTIQETTRDLSITGEESKKEKGKKNKNKSTWDDDVYE